MDRGIKIGLWFIVVPCVLIFGYGVYQYFTFVPFINTMAMLDGTGGGGEHFKSMHKGVTINVGDTSPTAQLLVGAGTCFMSVCYGIARIIKAWK